MNNHKDPMKLLAYTEPYSRTVGFLLRGERTVATNIIVEDFDPEMGFSHLGPLFRMEPENVQYLMDNLWNCGYRPSEGTGSAGAMAAIQAHLQDMRSIVFAANPQLKKPTP